MRLRSFCSKRNRISTNDDDELMMTLMTMILVYY